MELHDNSVVQGDEKRECQLFQSVFSIDALIVGEEA